MDNIKEFVRVSRKILGEENIRTIILFGSKSMGTDDEWSDYDFYVLTRKKFGWDEKFEIYRKFDFPLNIVFRTNSEMNEGIDLLCSIDIYALCFGTVVYGEELDREKENVIKMIEKGEIILRPELGKGVMEYGTET